MNIKPLSNALDVEVSGLNLSQESDPDFISKIISLLYEHAVVCIRGQKLHTEDLATFSSKLGTPVEHTEEDLRLNGQPAVMSLSNADSRDDRQLNGGSHWHTDLIHTEEPASFTMQHAVAVPETGGRTLFANQVAAYNALSTQMQEKIAELEVIHCYEGRTDGSMPEMHYPLVRPHPVTKVNTLYGAADTGIGIVGLPQDEAMALYNELGEHATQEQFVYRHKYTVNDVVIWDNSQLLHSAEQLQRAKSEKEQRIMHRVSVRGWPQ